MAKRTKSVTWTQIYDAGPTRKVFELPDGGRIRLVEISETPTYDCVMVSSRDICMHVIWVMLRKLNVNENDDIIQQKSIPVNRVKRLLRSEEHAVSSGVTASSTSGVSAATTALPPATGTTAISGGFFHNIGVSTTNIAIPPAASTTAISGGFLPYGGSSIASRAILLSASTTAISGGFLPNSGSSTTCRILLLAAGTTAISGGFFHNIGVSATSRALPPAASTTAISGGLLPNSGSSTTCRALPPAAGTKAITGGFLPNSGSSTTSRALPPAVSTTAISSGFSNNFTTPYPHFPPHVYQSHERMPWHNSNPFVIVPINNRIKKCAGCPFEFLDASGPTFTGLVVRHCEKDFYIDKTGHQMVGRETNRYYHCENGCLLNRHPYFSPALIRLEPGLKLNSFQLNHLQRALHVQFQ
ncbi:unnamed protein product [Porites lobata]|uniref:SWIM-type domain-containing protein n=1 Tax=Porites lobata TaxID=104759 RepID=A0ABN8RXC0_9CNID|nr:unnamed protein product [Porites lobata]